MFRKSFRLVSRYLKTEQNLGCNEWLIWEFFKESRRFPEESLEIREKNSRLEKFTQIVNLRRIKC